MRRLARRILECALLLAIAGAAGAEWLYDGYPIYNRGIAIGKDRPTEMAAQPFSVPRQARVEQ